VPLHKVQLITGICPYVVGLVPHSNITLLFRFSASARVALVLRVTARSLQNNIVGYVPPSGERSCNKCVKALSVVV